MSTATPTSTEHRIVISEDPGLSPRANALLTEQLREVIGSDRVDVPVGTTHHAAERHPKRPWFVGTLIQAQIGVAVMAFSLLVTGAILTLITGSVWALVGALVLHGIGTFIVFSATLRTMGENEHLSPELAARLGAEGVADPDRVFEDLLEEFTGVKPDPWHSVPAATARRAAPPRRAVMHA
jgi:hypothetical protein